MTVDAGCVGHGKAGRESRNMLVTNKFSTAVGEVECTLGHTRAWPSNPPRVL